VTTIHSSNTPPAGRQAISTASLSTGSGPRPLAFRKARSRRLLGLIPLGAAALILLSACAAPFGGESGSAAAGSAAAPAATQSAPASAAPASAQPTPSGTESTGSSQVPESTPPADTPQPAATLAPLVASAAAVPAPASSAQEESAPEAPQSPAAADVPAAPVSGGYGCDAALAYLRANAEPSYQLVCPGYAYGGQAVTCNHHAPECADYNIIIINVPCEIAYKNEAANSWTLVRGDGAAMDPFGSVC
jgi:hypothetical protein